MAALLRHGGGLRIPSGKHTVADQPLRAAPRPSRVLLALRQALAGGAELPPCVAVGQRVRAGECVARSAIDVCAALHAPIGGRVVDIGLPAGSASDGSGPCIVIEAEGAGDLDIPHFVPLGDGYRALAPDELLARLRDSGLAGLGGGVYALDSKVAQARRTGCALLLLNGVECDPWICCDDRLMRDRAAEVLDGAQVLLHLSGAARCVLAVGDDKPEAQAALRVALGALDDARIELRAVPSYYPGGAEWQLIETLTGHELPAAVLPADVGVLCHNVGSAAALSRYVRSGEPLLRRIVTIAGGGVTAPCNVEAWIGTPIGELLALAGGPTPRTARLIVGGAMGGIAFADGTAPLTKAGNCVVAAIAEDLGRAHAAAEQPCIRCGDCASACPVDLQPQRLHWALRAGDEAALAELRLGDCIECGCCDYVCPSAIPLTSRFHAAHTAQKLRRRTDALSEDWRRRHVAQLARRERSIARARREFEQARVERDSGPNAPP